MAWFDCAVRRPIGANTGGLLTPNLGLILHHAVGNGSNFNHFNSPSARVSAHFWVSKTGVVEQYVDTGVVAWHGMNLNSRYCGTETEGCGTPPHAEPMTEAMVDALARLYAEGMRRHGWAARTIDSAGASGFGFHRMPGSGAATGCPCDVRKDKRAEILRRAGGAPPGPTPPPTEGDDLTPEEHTLLRQIHESIPMLRDIAANVAGTGPMNEIKVGMLRDIQTRLVDGIGGPGADEPKPGFGALQTLDWRIRDLYHRVEAMEAKLSK